MTAEALKTMIRPTKTSNIVTVKSHRSTLTRLAMTFYFNTGRGRARILDRSFSANDCRVWFLFVPEKTFAIGPGGVDGRGRPSLHLIGREEMRCSVIGVR